MQVGVLNGLEDGTQVALHLLAVATRQQLPSPDQAVFDVGCRRRFGTGLTGILRTRNRHTEAVRAAGKARHLQLPGLAIGNGKAVGEGAPGTSLVLAPGGFGRHSRGQPPEPAGELQSGSRQDEWSSLNYMLEAVDPLVDVTREGAGR